MLPQTLEGVHVFIQCLMVNGNTKTLLNEKLFVYLSAY